MLTTMTTSQCAYFTDEYIQSLKASYPNRSYHGKPEYECSHCHAIFWYAERHIDMVLSDQEGNAIYAEIPANLVERKAPDIEEGGVYIISRFRVCAAKNAFKAVDGDKMIQFMFHTIVKRVMNPTTVFPTYVYRLTPFDQIESNIQTKPNFLDVLGVIVEVHELTPIHI
ncbi:hypothetical protein ZEAMMB73_Zm00001d047338 [Zea mays]|uniref:Replication protein A 70 kDa DNA-binding subunit B/D first OB fold domain-containing protein n=2 Tax=Zea mays TaxID=4577 RepID=A0A1D6P8P7_MAIZE|nr:hypothetical protein ZEAMMB73_Zm00001d047338 [Zea mays]AQL06174.1 hypothetical protein ZEAMMB73_Zm00001d047338 [Zea mays]